MPIQTVWKAVCRSRMETGNSTKPRPDLVRKREEAEEEGEGTGAAANFGGSVSARGDHVDCLLSLFKTSVGWG